MDCFIGIHFYKKPYSIFLQFIPLPTFEEAINLTN
jgi:hypothetical protein